MPKLQFALLRLLVCIVFLSIGQVVSAQDTKSKDQGTTDPTLQALLAEVHGLRLALERATTNASRAQILMERIRLTQPKVDNLTAQLSLVRGKITDEMSMQARVTEAINVCESKLATNQTFPSRADYEKECKSYPAMLEGAKQTEQRLREQESQLAVQLQIEQSKLDELNDRLDKLDRELQDAQPVDKTPARKNP